MSRQIRPSAPAQDNRLWLEADFPDVTGDRLRPKSDFPPLSGLSPESVKPTFADVNNPAGHLRRLHCPLAEQALWSDTDSYPA